MAFIPQPIGLDFETWASIIIEQYAGEGMPSGLPKEVDWKEWGNRIQEVDALSDIPYTGNFDAWQPWADRVVESLSED